MITLLSIQTVRPDRVDEYLRIQRRVWEQTHKSEPGMVRYEHYRSAKDRQFYSLLSFASLEAFLDHQVADYHDAVDWEGMFEELSLQWLDPIPGANALEPTVLPGLADDESELRRQYAAMLPSDRPSWWGAPGD